MKFVSAIFFEACRSQRSIPAALVFPAHLPHFQRNWVRGLLVLVAFGLLASPATAAVEDKQQNDQEVSVQWSEELLMNFRDGTVFAVRLAEQIGKKAGALTPTLQVSSTLDLHALGLKPGKYWYGVRLPKKWSNLDLHNTFGFMSDELIRTQSRWTVPLGAGFNLPMTGRNSLTINFLLNVGAGPSSSKDHLFPGITIGLRF